MDKDVLYEILKSKSEKLSAADIEAIMNEELDKSPEEMDTDLVDRCLDALAAANTGKSRKKRIRVNFVRALAAAVIIVLLIGIGIPVGATRYNLNIPEGVITFYKDYISFDLSNDKGAINIDDKLKNDNFNDAVLPLYLYDSVRMYDYTFEGGDLIDTITFRFENDELSGDISLIRYKADFPLKNRKLPGKYDDIKYIDKNGIPILVISNKDFCYIYYYIDETSYTISINCDFETACQIAETV